MRRTFPDMNSPEAEIYLQDDDGVLADCTIGGSLCMPDSHGRRPSLPLAKRRD
jgi:hypothetical protein